MEGQEAYPVSEGADRFGSPAFFLNGRFDCKVSGQDTDGRLCIFDTVRTHTGGPPLHYHEDQEEGTSCAKASSSSRSARNHPTQGRRLHSGPTMFASHLRKCDGYGAAADRA